MTWRDIYIRTITALGIGAAVALSFVLIATMYVTVNANPWIANSALVVFLVIAIVLWIVDWYTSRPPRVEE